MHLFNKIVPTDAREELGAARFLIGDDRYIDWIWKERMRAFPTKKRARGLWPFSRAQELPSNVTLMSKAKGVKDNERSKTGR